MFHIISNPSDILEDADEIDSFISKWSKNPFLLSGFISQFMKSNHVKGWIPIVLIIKANETIVGTAPLAMKTKLGIRFVKFFPRDTFSPDFVFSDGYSELCMESV